MTRTPSCGLKRRRSREERKMTPLICACRSLSVKYMWPVFQTLQFESSPSTHTSKKSRSSSERIRSLLERDFFEVWVEGELSNCKVWNTGHMYFTLKDRQAQIKGVIFRSSLLRLRFKPQDGVRVIARGRVTVYDPKGEYQLLCEHMEPEGVGARQLAFEQLRERLSKEGLFAQERNRPLPVLLR